ncbi:hypothetical protein HGRIS_013922 [Hohenbuehelia grisea]|uniref:Uncharacterized protein n=1 Tax=Hohenbuehelia grisea TaxID=104357 RepID=A0ABR3JSM6_9AGAR
MNSAFRFLLLLSVSAAITGTSARPWGSGIPETNTPPPASNGDDIYSKILESAGKPRNDWSQACVDKCAFDIPKSENGTGYMEFSGAGIVDITPAGGWTFNRGCLGSEYKPDEHKLLAVKVKDKGNSFAAQGRGISFRCTEPGTCPDARTFEGKLARLPASHCSAYGFAILKNIQKDGDEFTASISIDLKDAAIDGRFVLSGVTFGGQPTGFSMNTSGSHTPSRFSPRAELSTLFDFDRSVDATLIETSLSISGEAHFTAKVGIHVEGSLWGGIEKAYAFTVLNGKVSGVVDLSLSVEGKFDTEEISLAAVGIPGLTFGMFFKVGPTLELLTRADGAFKIKADMNYKFDYKMEETELRFPDDGRRKIKSKPEETPLTMELDQSIEAHGYIRGHVIPRLTVSIAAWGIGDAAIFVDVDASMTAEVTAWGARAKSLLPIPADDKDSNGKKVDEKDSDADGPTFTDFAQARKQWADWKSPRVDRKSSEWRLGEKILKRKSDKHDKTEPLIKIGNPLIYNQFANTTGAHETVDVSQPTMEMPEANSTEWNSAYGGHFNLTATLDVRVGAFVKTGEVAEKILDLLDISDSLGKTFIVWTHTFKLYEFKWGKEADGHALQKRSKVSHHAPVIPLGEKTEFKTLSEPGEGKSLLPIKIPGLNCTVDANSDAYTALKDAFKHDRLSSTKTIQGNTKPVAVREKRELAEF